MSIAKQQDWINKGSIAALCIFTAVSVTWITREMECGDSAAFQAAAVPAPLGHIEGILRIDGTTIGSKGVDGISGIITSGSRPYRVEFKGTMATILLGQSPINLFGRRPSLAAKITIGAPGQATAVQVTSSHP